MFTRDKDWLLLLLLLSRFSRVRLCATPWTAAHQVPPSLGFSRQEYWSGVLFPSPMHESEKWKWSRSVMSNSLRPLGLQPTRLLHPWDSPGKSTGVGCHCLLHKDWLLTLFLLLLPFPRANRGLVVNSTTGTHLSVASGNAERRLADCEFPTWNPSISYFTGSLNSENKNEIRIFLNTIYKNKLQIR